MVFFLMAAAIHKYESDNSSDDEQGWFLIPNHPVDEFANFLDSDEDVDAQVFYGFGENLLDLPAPK